MSGLPTLVATVVDTTALWQTVVAAIGAGVGVTFVFSLAILGSVRLADMARDGRTVAAAAFGVMTAVALLTCAAAITFGIIVMTAK
jgi:hypothetical protein